MRPIFAGEVVICSPVQLNPDKQTARFTVKYDRHHYFISTVGLGQYEMMAELQHAGPVRLFVFGHLFSYKADRCRQDHNGVEPLWMVPLDSYEGNPATLRSIAAQWFTASLLTLDHGHKQPRRDRLETQEV
ncbi:MAG: hypothetical protein BroJett011_62040 [Chloroflexota bacterium]|nr:MAG: hypothetical protein BroJett011_62040 [Chloroflexota bacterium]